VVIQNQLTLACDTTIAPAPIAITIYDFSISESNLIPGNIGAKIDAVFMRAMEAFQLSNFFFLQRVLTPVLAEFNNSFQNFWVCNP
jgi:hypothetical protein